MIDINIDIDIETWIDIYWFEIIETELVHIIMEAYKSQDPPSVSWKTRKADCVIQT